MIGRNRSCLNRCGRLWSDRGSTDPGNRQCRQQRETHFGHLKIPSGAGPARLRLLELDSRVEQFGLGRYSLAVAKLRDLVGSGRLFDRAGARLPASLRRLQLDRGVASVHLRQLTRLLQPQLGLTQVGMRHINLTAYPSTSEDRNLETE